MIINIQGNNITHDFTIIANTVKSLGGHVKQMIAFSPNMFKIITPAKSRLVILAMENNNYNPITDNERSILRAIDKNHALLADEKSFLTQFPNHTYRTFSFAYLLSPDSAMSITSGSIWDFMQIIRECPNYTQED